LVFLLDFFQKIMAVPFSANDQEVINRTIELQSDAVNTIEDIFTVFEVTRCIDWINENNLTNVTLQFPDSLISYSPAVVLAIEHGLGQT
jgi:hypothetical protein